MEPKQEIVELTKKLISFKTITGEAEEVEKAFLFLKEYLKPSQLTVKKYKSGVYSALVIVNQNGHNNNFDLLLHGHIDIVPGLENQYKPKVKNNRLYGRGALDMKGGLATLVVLMKNLKQEKINKKLALFITSDEEKGGENGTRYLLENIGYRGKFFITAEGEKKYVIKNEQKGVLMLKLAVKTSGEHSAYTWKAKNAILELVELYQKIAKLFPHKQDPKHWYTTINMGKIQGGRAVNSIPDYAEAEIDIRFCDPFATPEAVFNKIIPIIRKKNNASNKVIYKTNPTKTSSTNKHLKLLDSIIKKELGLKKNLYFKNPGTNDARFANKVRIPAISFGPIGDNYHAQNEYVLIESLEAYYNIISNFIKNFE